MYLIDREISLRTKLVESQTRNLINEKKTDTLSLTWNPNKNKKKPKEVHGKS